MWTKLKGIYAIKTKGLWEKLGNLATSIKNGTPARQNFERRGFRVARIETISKGIVDPEKVGWVDSPVEEFQNYKLCDGDILFSHINSLEKLGNCAIYEGAPENLYHGVNLLLIKVNQRILEPYYLLCWLRSDYCKGYYLENARRAIGQASLNQKDIREIPVFILPLSVQKKISSKIKALLQDVEKAGAACERQLEAARALKAAYLRQVFDSEKVKKWDKKRLSEVCDYQPGIWGEEPDGSSQCQLILRSNNIRDRKIIFDDVAVRKVERKYLASKALIPGDILVATSSGSKEMVGKSAIFIPADEKTYLFSNFTLRLRAIPNLVNPFYLYFYLQSPQARRLLGVMQDTTTGLRNLNRKEFLGQLIPLPPSLGEQQKVVAEIKERLVEVEKLYTATQSQLEAISALPQAILRRAFEEGVCLEC